MVATLRRWNGDSIMGAVVGCALFFVLVVLVTAVVEGFDLLKGK